MAPKRRNSYRLNRYLARSGVASRRKCDELISQGLVRVNGTTVLNPGHRVTDGDRVTCRDREIELQPLMTVVLNKPHGYETTLSSKSGRSISALMRGLPPGTVPVGRLDINTGGLLLLSNDGELVNRLMHPSWEVEREYRVFLRGAPSADDLSRLRRGADIGSGEMSVPIEVKRSGSRSVNIVLHTGRNREVRRLLKACGIDMEGLERVRYGPITIEGVARGEWRELGDDELSALMQAVDMSRPPSIDE